MDTVLSTHTLHAPTTRSKEAVDDDTLNKAIEQTLKDLERVEASEPRFMELVARLQELVEQHATEESSQFPALRAAVPREKLVELRAKVDTAKKLAPTRPHPDAPNAELFHKLVGPGPAWLTGCATNCPGAPNQRRTSAAPDGPAEPHADRMCSRLCSARPERRLADQHRSSRGRGQLGCAPRSAELLLEPQPGPEREEGRSPLTDKQTPPVCPVEASILLILRDVPRQDA
jgi:hypothetical protein